MFTYSHSHLWNTSAQWGPRLCLCDESHFVNQTLYSLITLIKYGELTISHYPTESLVSHCTSLSLWLLVLQLLISIISLSGGRGSEITWTPHGTSGLLAVQRNILQNQHMNHFPGAVPSIIYFFFLAQQCSKNCHFVKKRYASAHICIPIDSKMNTHVPFLQICDNSTVFKNLYFQATNMQNS